MSVDIVSMISWHTLFAIQKCIHSVVYFNHHPDWLWQGHRTCTIIAHTCTTYISVTRIRLSQWHICSNHSQTKLVLCLIDDWRSRKLLTLSVFVRVVCVFYGVYKCTYNLSGSHVFLRLSSTNICRPRRCDNCDFESSIHVERLNAS